MDWKMYVIAGLVGWCPMPRPKPKPPPIPIDPFFGIVGGIAGAYLVHSAINLGGTLEPVGFLAIAVGAFVVGRVFQQLALWIFPPRED